MLNILKRGKIDTSANAASLGAFLEGFSIEVMPRTAA